MRYEIIWGSGCAIMRKWLLDQENEVWYYLGKWLFHNEETISLPREWGMTGKDYLTKRMRYEVIWGSGCAIMRKRLLDQENEVWDFLGKWLFYNEEKITWPRENKVWEEKITWPREIGMRLSGKWLCHNEEKITWPRESGIRISGEVVVS
jgi:hypothetical protein